MKQKVAWNLQEAMDLIGGVGKFHWIVVAYGLISDIRLMSVIILLPIYELEPAYECYDSVDDYWYACKPEQSFCNDASIEHRVDYSKPESLENYFVRLNMECKSHKEIGKIGSTLFIGIVLGCLFIPRLADIYGRKWFVTVSHIVLLITLFALPSM